MSDAATRTTFSYRDLVAAVRAELVAIGRQEVKIERSWIDEDEPGYRFILRVPLGTELIVPLTVTDNFFNARSADDLKRHAAQFAIALVNLLRAEKMLIRYARDVRRATNEVIAAARAEGLDLHLDRVGFKPTYVSHLAVRDWKDAAHHVLAAITIKHTSFYLRPDTSVYWVEEPADVANELHDLLEEQRERQLLIAELDAAGADLTVDGLTLDLLSAHGFDVEETLRRVWKMQCLNLSVNYGGRNASMSLVSGDGKVTASIDLFDAVWNGEHLWFTGEEQKVDHSELVGRPLGDLVPHPVFTSRPVTAVTNRQMDMISFDLSDQFRFDAETGRLWREERLAA